MNRLLRVEITRLTWRKVPLLSFVVLLAIVLLTLGATHMQAGDMRPGSEAYQEAVAGYEEYKADQEANGAQYLAECLEGEAQDREDSNDPTIDYFCDEQGDIGTVQEWIGGLGALEPEVGILLSGLTPIFLLVPLLVGASATAAEYANRTMGTWLTFEPRRTRVFFSKLLAVALVSAPLTALMVAVTIVGMFGVFAINGLPTELDSAAWQTLVWRGARITLLAGVVAAVGAAAGTLVRRTSVVLGLVLVYTLAGEGLIRGLVPSLTPALLGSNISAFAENGWKWFSYPRCDENGPCEAVEHTISLLQGGTVVGVVALVLIIGAWLVFRRRDVE